MDEEILPIKDITIGFIGAGGISVQHAAAVSKCPGAVLKGLWNITPELAAEKSEAFGCEIYPSAEALFSKMTTAYCSLLTLSSFA